MLSYGLSFARSVLLARLLTKADFGLAAMFGMTLSILEIAGRMSFGQQIIQSKDGDTESFQATSQAFQSVLVTFQALLLICLSYPLALAFKVPQLTWAFALLAVVPLTKGLENLDYFRRQRTYDYLPAVLNELVPQLIVTLASWPLAVWLGDFRVIVWLMLGKAGLGLFMSHCLAKRPYRWAWRWDTVKMMWLFGWPLLLNGLMMFASQQADQVLVGAFLSLEVLAGYSLVLSIVSIPWYIFGQVGSSLMLPMLARVQDDPEQFRRQYRACVEYAGVGGVVLVLPLIVAGEQMVTLLYGPKYVGTGTLMALLGAVSVVRFFRLVPSIAATARADTMNHLYTNLWRGLSLPLAATVALMGGGVALIAGCALVAELVASAVSLLRLRRYQGVPLRDTASVVGYVLGFLTMELALVYFGACRWGYWLAAGATMTLLALSIGVAWVAFPSFSRTVTELIAYWRMPEVQRPTFNALE